MEIFTESEIRDYYTQRVPSLKITSQRELRGPCPVHNGKDLNFAVRADTGEAFCHSQCGKGWDIIGLESDLFGLDFVKAKKAVYLAVGRPEPRWEDRDIQAVYDYCDEGGIVSYQVVRKFGKQFLQRRPGGTGWVWGLGELKPLPFRLPQFKDSPFVAIAEGEKDVLALERLGIPATCNNGGAGNFRPELAYWFAGKKVAVFPDNDEKGKAHAMKVAELLAPVAASVRIVELPGLPHKGDVSDFIGKGGTLAKLRELWSKAVEWTPEFQFAAAEPSDSDRYIRTLAEAIDEAGGMDRFWDFRIGAGLPTPFRPLTKTFSGGMRDGEVYVIGANQGAGKTSLALQFAVTVLRERKGVLIFSMEMGHREVFQRLCSMEARVDLNEFREAQNSSRVIDHQDYREMRQRLQIAMSELLDAPLLVSTKSSVTPDYIIEESQRLKARFPLSLVVVDHLQLMGSTGSVRSDYEKFTNISRAVKHVATELKVPVLLVSQTSRANAERKTTELEVSDLRGSGAIEEDAAGVMLLYEDRDDSKQQQTSGTYARGPVKTWLKVGKNRYGMSGAYLPLMHFKTCTRFDLYAEDQNATN